MHIKTISRTTPAAAVNVQIALDIILQFINVLEAIERITGLDLSSLIPSKEDNGTVS